MPKLWRPKARRSEKNKWTIWETRTKLIPKRKKVDTDYLYGLIYKICWFVFRNILMLRLNVDFTCKALRGLSMFTFCEQTLHLTMKFTAFTSIYMALLQFLLEQRNLMFCRSTILDIVGQSRVQASQFQRNQYCLFRIRRLSSRSVSWNSGP